MTQKFERKVPLYIQVAIIANIILFGVFGVIYLARSSNFLGTMLLVAGLTNVVLLLFSFNKKNTFFMVLNFIYAALSFIVFYDFKSPKYIGYIWLVLTLYYLISAFYLMYRLNKEKKKTTTAN
jgi:hypothetical protein